MNENEKKSFFTSEDLKRILLCILSGTVMALNLRTFVRTGGLFPGGMAGLSTLLQGVGEKFWGVSIPYGNIYMVLNGFPILLGFLKVGKKFTGYSCITIVLVAVLTDLIPAYTITYDILLISVFGGIINGAAVAIALHAGATTGGTDFIAAYISEHLGMDGFTCVLVFNAVMLCTAGLLFGWERALYSIIFQYASTQIIHLLNNRYKKNTLLIITDYPEEMIRCLNRDVRHGVTEMHVMGTYKEQERTMLYSVISNSELKMVLRDLHETDPHAFINVIKTEQVNGRFYIKPND
jgi:uncharacterized membrane-anchored protein YitT (DUF2179 family)